MRAAEERMRIAGVSNYPSYRDLYVIFAPLPKAPMDRISAQQSKLIKRLTLKKYRKIEQMFLVEGVKLLEELKQQSLFTIEHIFCTPEHVDQLKGLKADVSITICDPKDLSKHSQLATSPGIMAVVRIPQANRELTMEQGWTLVLDGVSDPGNLGTLIRIADWFGYTNVLCTDDCADAFNSKVVQASMGSIFRKAPQYFKRAEIVTRLSDMPVFIADMQGAEVGGITWPSRAALVMGSESHGPSKDLQHIGKAITIPKMGGAESLNVSIAAAVISSQIFL